MRVGVATISMRSFCNPLLAAGCLMAVSMSNAAHAQSITPMRGEVKSFTDRFAVRVFAMNPYNKRMKVEVKVYDETFKAVEAIVLPSEAMVGAQDSRSVMVMVPFDGQRERRIRICAESVPFTTQTSRLRTQVCGKFFAQRVR